MIRSIQECQQPEHSIPGVQFKELKTFPDDRGYFRELIRVTDPFFHRTAAATDMQAFAQWSHSKMGRNTVKAWHFHHRQVDWWYLPIGLVHAAFIDNREESPTYRKKIEFLLGENEIDPSALQTVVRIPQGVLHGCRVLSEFAHLFYITSEIYNPQDEGRIPFNDPEIAHNWGNEEELIVVPNDRKLHIPPFSRTELVT